MNQWINRSHPTTLIGAVFLCYLNAIQALMFALGISRSPGIVVTDEWTFLIVALGLGFGGIGIANDMKWGYWLALVVSMLHLALYAIVFDFTLKFLGTLQLVSFVFDVTLVLLLTHSQAREYQRVWFR